ncbi:MAG: hypothetical protein Q8916_13500 [Bacteroidota bacterium]|nr:hypothetical protein [Bacteroidota bacterium]MDP4231409.1 hypothetical protein [Bacteroidota bacterium]MDP4237149.1 hypothetical protein [Bacteroidota bacterium]
MSKIKNFENTPDPDNNQPHIPYWRRAHHDWKFWVVLILMLAAMVIYIMTLDLQTRSPIGPG